MTPLKFKRGDTFLLTCQYTVDDVATALPPGIRSQLRTGGGKQVADLTVTVTGSNTFTLSAAPEDTAKWPASRLGCDIEYTDADGNVSSTDTFWIDVQPDMTQ